MQSLFRINKNNFQQYILPKGAPRLKQGVFMANRQNRLYSKVGARGNPN